MAESTKARAKGRKIGRNKDYCDIYKKAGLQDKNRKRRMRRHMRDNPDDEFNAREYEKSYGKVHDIGLTKRGERRKMQSRGKNHSEQINSKMKA